jgi:thiamine biosynthesis lipoprotein
MMQTEQIMGMPVTVEVVSSETSETVIQRTFDYFRSVDARYSTYKKNSEISRVNRGLPADKWSDEMSHIFELSEQTKQETDGYFDIGQPGKLDPSGMVKGWAINQAARKLRAEGVRNFRIDAGGDIQVGGTNAEGKPWRIGIRNPFDRRQIVKIIEITGQGVATSGTAIRGQHIYNPHQPGKPLTEIASLTVIGPSIYDADRFATAAFAMGPAGIMFIEKRPELEGYMIGADRKATFTSGFERFVAQ